MDRLESNIRAVAVRNALNNFALEGYVPDKALQALTDKYVACEISYEEYRRLAFEMFNRPPMNIYETGLKLANFEAAQEVLTAVASFYAGKIYDEEKKPDPCQEKIKLLEDEAEKVRDLLFDLSLDDEEGVKSTLDFYSAKYKALTQNE